MREKINIQRRIFTVIHELDERRLDYVISFFTDLPRREARELVENGLVLVNNKLITFPSKKVKEGDKIAILEAKEELTPEPEIIYEDDYVIVVNKPSGLLTEKVGSEKGNALNEIFANRGKILYPVHRLDRETSGVMIFAKNENARDFLIEEFRNRKINKIYIGIVEGMLGQKSGVLKGLIQKTKEYAETHYEVMKILKNATILLLMPKTGRTHQLRLQLAQMGHPIIGDKKYYNIKKTKIFFHRQALHSYKINFVHPETKRWVSFTAPIPQDMKELIESLAR
ncbi:MAG: RluA family pseudouridine synthase [candidate division WOR-3 bacterium]